MSNNRPKMSVLDKMKLGVVSLVPLVFVSASLLGYSRLGYKAPDNSVTWAIDPDSMYVRSVRGNVLPTFSQLVQRLYGDAPIRGWEPLFSKRVLRRVGLTPLSGEPALTCDQSNIAEYRRMAVAHAFYNPVRFLPESYSIIRDSSGRRLIDPSLPRRYPGTILMVPFDDELAQTVFVIDCKQTVIMVPNNRVLGSSL